MSLINCKIKLSVKWVKNCVLSTAAIGANANITGADSATFKITDAKLSVPAVTLSAEDNKKLVKQLNEEFNRSVYWKKYKVIDNKVVEITAANEENISGTYVIQVIKELQDCLFLLMILQQVIIKFLMIPLRSTFFHELKLKTATSKLMEEIFMISQLMTQKCFRPQFSKFSFLGSRICWFLDLGLALT